MFNVEDNLIFLTSQECFYKTIYLPHYPEKIEMRVFKNSYEDSSMFQKVFLYCQLFCGELLINVCLHISSHAVLIDQILNIFLQKTIFSMTFTWYYHCENGILNME